MIDILKRTIKNRFQVLMYILNEQNIKNFMIFVLLEDFLFFPEKKDMVYIIHFLDNILIKQPTENITYHISIIKRDLDTFFDTFSKQNQTENLKLIDIIRKKWIK